MPGIKSLSRLSKWQKDALDENLHPQDERKFRRPASFRMSSLKADLRRRTLDEFPMDHSCADVTRMSARRRQEKDANTKNLVSTRGESNQLKSYSRRRFETALTVSGKSLPPPSPEDKRIFWDEVKPTWTHRRHHSVIEHQTLTKPSAQLTQTRPGSEPPRLVFERGNEKATDGALRFNHLRGHNGMYPSIKRLLQESNVGYRVVSATPNLDGDGRSYRPLSVNHSDITDCYLIPKEEVCPGDANDEGKIAERTSPNAQQNTDEENGSGHNDSVDGSAEYIGDSMSMDAKNAAHQITQQTKEEDEGDEEEDNDEPSPPWRCWVDDATVSSIDPDPEKLDPTDDVTPTSPSPSAEDPLPDVPTPPVDVAAEVPVSKTRLSVPGRPSKMSSASLDKRESATSPVSEVPVGKRKSSGRLKKKKGRKGTPEPPPVEVVELPPTPPPPPTPPVVEVVEEEPKEEEKEVEFVLPSYICPSSTAKSTEVEIRMWLRKSTFTGANRTLPILF